MWEESFVSYSRFYLFYRIKWVTRGWYKVCDTLQRQSMLTLVSFYIKAVLNHSHTPVPSFSYSVLSLLRCLYINVCVIPGTLMFCPQDKIRIRTSSTNPYRNTLLHKKLKFTLHTHRQLPITPRLLPEYVYLTIHVSGVPKRWLSKSGPDG